MGASWLWVDTQKEVMTIAPPSDGLTPAEALEIVTGSAPDLPLVCEPSERWADNAEGPHVIDREQWLQQLAATHGLDR